LAAVAALHAVHRRQWMVLVAFTITVSVWAGATEWLMPGVWADYVHSLRFNPPPASIFTATLNGWGRAMFGEWFAGTAWAVCTGLSVVMLWLVWKTSSHQLSAEVVGLVCTLVLCASPHALSYDYVLMLPAFLGAVGAYFTFRRLSSIAVLIAWLILDATLIYGSLQHWHEIFFWWIPWAGLVLTVIQFHMSRETEPHSTNKESPSVA
jgi:hypothetical protein